LITDGCPRESGSVQCATLYPDWNGNGPAECGMMDDGCGRLIRCRPPGQKSACPEPATQRCLDHKCVDASQCTLLAETAVRDVAGSSWDNVWFASDVGLTHWNGSDCAAIPSPPGPPVRFLQVNSPTDVYAVGVWIHPSNTAIYTVGKTNNTWTLSHWNGDLWMPLLTEMGGSPGDFWAAPDGDVYVAMGSYAIYKYNAGLGILETVSLPTNTGPTDTVSCIHSSDCTDWCPAGSTCSCPDTQLCTQNAKSSDLQPHAIWGVSESDLWIGGNVRRADISFLQGPLIHRENGVETLHPTGNVHSLLVAIHGTDANNVWLAGHNNADSTPTVISWDGVEFTNHAETDSTHFNDIFSVGPDAVWAVGPQGIWYFDGAAWIRQPHPAGHPVTFFAVWGSSATDVWAVGEQEWIGPNNGGYRRSVVLHYDGTAWTLN